MIPDTHHEADDPYNRDGITDSMTDGMTDDGTSDAVNMPESGMDASAPSGDEMVGVDAEYPHDAPHDAYSTEKSETVLRDFEDLTLAEMIGQFWRAPRATYTALVTIANRPARPRFSRQRLRSGYSRPSYGGSGSESAEAPVYTSSVPVEPLLVSVPAARRPRPEGLAQPARLRRAIPRLLLQTLSLIFAILGGMAYYQINSVQLLYHISPSAGLPFFAVAAGLWFASELIARANEHEIGTAIRAHQPADELFVLNMPQIVMLAAALGLAVLTYFLNNGMHFTPTGVLAWLGSIILICLYGLSSTGVYPSPSRAWRRLRDGISDFSVNNGWMIVALIVITIAGAAFRLLHLDVMLPEMTSDHVEKLLDAQRVAYGDYQIFFINNGGREPFQMYALAALSILPGIEIDFMGLKLLAVIESVITIPIFWWMGRAVIGDRDDDTRRLGNWVGLAAALLLAGGYWHAAITRVALRIILTPLVVGLLLIFLSRAMRYNRRADFVWAGLVLGFGVYTYQAIRMLPLVVVIGVVLALFFRLRNHHQRVQMVFNLALLVIVSFIIFVPMFRFSVERPQDFWRRTEGRLFGDDVISVTLPDGRMIERNASLTERVEAFVGNFPKITGNLVRAVGMFNYRGDLAWFHNAPLYPAMDTLTGALLVVGVVGWGMLIIRTRDAVYLLIPIALLVMLLPSALSIANIQENPSHTRASGAMPSAYLLAAFGLASVCYTLRRTTRHQIGVILATLVLIGVGSVVFWGSGERLFGPYREFYIKSWNQPLSDAGEFLEDFAYTGGGYGNAFMMSFPHWWDHRAVAIEAGLPPGVWPNGDTRLVNVPGALASAARRPENNAFRLNADRELLFLYAPEDTEAESQFQTWFPDGQVSLIPTYMDGVHFKVYRVPALGIDGLRRFLAANGIAL